MIFNIRFTDTCVSYCNSNTTQGSVALIVFNIAFYTHLKNYKDWLASCNQEMYFIKLQKLIYMMVVTQEWIVIIFELHNCIGEKLFTGLILGIGMDASVTPLRHGGLSLVQTTDFFYPLVDDPYMMVCKFCEGQWCCNSQVYFNTVVIK